MDGEYPAPLWTLPDPDDAPAGEDLVVIGGGLDPGTLLDAYRRGLFPMNVSVGPEMGGGEVLGWWSPDPRGILRLDDLRISRSLARSCRRLEVTFDRNFVEVMRACADPQRPQGWITEEFIEAYSRLHGLGFAHSVEVWRAGELVGGLYGVEVGGLFAGESMFHTVADASKVALVALVRRLRDCPGSRLIDVQWCTPHLASLGVTEVDRTQYLAWLPALVREPPCLRGETAAPGKSSARGSEGLG